MIQLRTMGLLFILLSNGGRVCLAEVCAVVLLVWGYCSLFFGDVVSSSTEKFPFCRVLQICRHVRVQFNSTKMQNIFLLLFKRNALL